MCVQSERCATELCNEGGSVQRVREINGFWGFKLNGYFGLFHFKCMCEKKLVYVYLENPHVY